MNVYHVKLTAKTCLAGRNGKAFLLLFGRAVLSVLLGAGGYCLRVFAPETQNTAWVTAGEIALLFVSVWLLSALRQGTAAWFLRCARGKRTSTAQVLYWIRHARSLKSRALHVAIRIRKTGWFVLFQIPCAALLVIWYYCRSRGRISGLPSYITLGGAVLCGVVGIVFTLLLCQQYGLGLYLLADDPSLTVRDAVRKSRAYMQPHCGKLLRLKLSFLPWFLSCVLIIPIVYVAPYYCQSVACRLADILSAVSFGCEQSAK